jgi:hypothetical protein
LRTKGHRQAFIDRLLALTVGHPHPEVTNDW